MFGTPAPTQTPASLFATPAPLGQQTPAPSTFGAPASSPLLSSFGYSSLAGAPPLVVAAGMWSCDDASQANWVERLPAPVRAAVARLGNPSQRGGQILQSTFERLQQMSSVVLPEHAGEAVGLLAFAYERDEAGAASNAEKQRQCDNLFVGKSAAYQRLLHQAKQKNPDPDRLHTVPLFGFDMLLARAEMQQAHLERLQSLVKDVHSRQTTLRHRIQQTTGPKLDDVKKRHVVLQAQFLRLCGLIEDRAKATNRYHKDDRLLSQLQNEMSLMSDRLQGSEAAPASLIELRMAITQIRANESQRPPAPVSDTGGTDDSVRGLSKRDAVAVMNLVESQQEFFDSLRQHLAHDVAAVETLLKTK